MCFSAPASFAASGVLAASGAVALKRAGRSPSRPFARIPVFFAVQQALEGVIWLTFGAPGFQAAVVHGFLFFSHILWPAYIPFAVRELEPDPRRKKFLSLFGWLGAAVSIYLLWFIVLRPVRVELSGHSLEYLVQMPDVPAGLGAYVLVTCGSCLASTRQMVRVFGLAMLGSFLLAYWAHRQSLYSIWCFFAAILSLIVLAHLWSKRG